MSANNPPCGASSRFLDAARQTFRSLRHRNFRLYSVGIMSSLIGSWMQIVVMGWLAYQLTHSSGTLGLLSFASLIPTIAFSLPAGWVAGRFDRRKILLVTQSLAFCQAITVTALAATGTVQVWHLVALSSVLGVLVAFELAARFPLIGELVEPQEIGNACSLDAFVFYGARASGPAIGGLLLSVFSPAICFGINAASYALELTTLLLIRKKPSETRTTGGAVSAGLRFLLRADNRAMFLLMAACSFFCAYLPLMPAYVSELVAGGATTLGLLVGASEVGALLASLWLARKLTGTLGRSVRIAALGAAVFMVVASFSGSAWCSALLLLPLGFCTTVNLMGVHAVMQERVDNDTRGMMSSMFWMTNLGLQSAGALCIGFLGEHFGIGSALASAGFACVLCAVVSLLVSGRDSSMPSK